MKRLFPFYVGLFAVLISPVLFAQQADDAQGNPPPDNVDLVTQVQQLRAEVERLSEQVDRLNTEIKSMQGTVGTTPAKTPAPRTSRNKSAPAPAPVVATPPASAAQTPDAIAITVLVFRDGHHVETKNYAIVGESIWVYTEQESKKYKLADLDLDATKKVNSDHGVLFELPPAR